MVKTLDSELGKIAKRYVKLVESANNLEELFKARNQVLEFLNSTTVFAQGKGFEGKERD